MPEPPPNFLDKSTVSCRSAQRISPWGNPFSSQVEGIPLGDKASAHTNKQSHKPIKDLSCETKDSPWGKRSFRRNEGFPHGGNVVFSRNEGFPRDEKSSVDTKMR